VVAKKLHARLATLGAVALTDRGLGDDQHAAGYEAALDPWLQTLWTSLRKRFPLPPGVTEVVSLSQGPPAAGLKMGISSSDIAHSSLLQPSPADASTELPAAKFRVTFLPPAEGRDGVDSKESSTAEAVDAARAFSELEASSAGMLVQPRHHVKGMSGCKSGGSPI
jgi:hypothetical protein